ncbi:NAD(+) synthase [Ornithobacterium rhinotracheale]|uniref:NAD(+) synthase n=1 Tax=Ornithobacterium rhinotracheale TaxID=28251 RepID=UPI00403554BB
MHTKEVINYIVDWLKDYLSKSGMDGWVIGISGGIDSAVVSTLTAQTGAPVLAIEMPIHQSQDQVNRAQDHIAWLEERYPNVKGMRVDLTPTFDALSEAVVADKNHAQNDLALANARSRLRMTTLYYYAGLNRYLVVGTGNKVEDFGVGFFTKYGDGGVDISPIGDLMKSEVFKLAKELDIIASIQNARPTDGLWNDDRTDEDQLGATYDELEWAMGVYKDHKPEDFEGRRREVLQIFNKFNRAMQHKINPIPVAIIPEELKK